MPRLHMNVYPLMPCICENFTREDYKKLYAAADKSVRGRTALKFTDPRTRHLIMRPRDKNPTRYITEAEIRQMVREGEEYQERVNGTAASGHFCEQSEWSRRKLLAGKRILS